MLFGNDLYLSDIGSDTLNLNPRPEDRALLSALINTPLQRGVSVNKEPETVSTVSKP
jgi:hypothetical protein